MRTILLLTAVVTLLFASRSSLAADPVKSSLQAGQKIESIFEPLNVNGPHAGELHCLVCENGTSPVAMVFAREVSEPLVRLAAKLDKAAVQNRAQSMGSFIVLLSEQENVRKQLEEVAKKQALQDVILSTFEAAGPEGFDVAKDADVTVVLYREFAVLANHSFRKGELNDQAIEKIVADLPKILKKK